MGMAIRLRHPAPDTLTAAAAVQKIAISDSAAAAAATTIVGAGAAAKDAGRDEHGTARQTDADFLYVRGVQTSH